MRYAAIYPFDISNGTGIRVSIFVQGCSFHCKGCFNSEAWDFKGGKEFTKYTLEYLMSLCEPDYISGLSVLGGEPLNENNIKVVRNICYEFKRRFPKKSIWLWTGYTLQEITDIISQEKGDHRKMLLDLLYGSLIRDEHSPIDVLIDGRFEEDKKDLSLKWRGSSNQHIWRKGGKKMSDKAGMWYQIE